MDLVVYWNKIGKYIGARADEVRAYAKDADNLYFELAKHNREDGGYMKDENGRRITYDPLEVNRASTC